MILPPSSLSVCIVIPIIPAATFDNEIPFPVCAGFDAAAGDDLGECFVSPSGYAHMTHMLSALAGGKMLVALEVLSLFPDKSSAP